MDSELCGFSHISLAVEAAWAEPDVLDYGVLSLGSWLFSYYLVPETKGCSLDEIESFWHQKPVTD